MLIQQISPTHQQVELQALSCIRSKSFPIQPFDEKVITFSGRLSKRILKDPQFGRVPALVTLAYWLRPSNLSRIANENLYLTQHPNIQLSPIGLVFHVCPANVDTMFIYSLMVSILMGNKNILRVSNRLDHEYILFLFEVVNQELAAPENEVFRDYINIVTYHHESEINQFFAEHANARLIWGGDQTAKNFKSIFGNPRSKDIVFADRISLSIIDTTVFIQADIEKKQKIVKDFYNDAYTFDQKGCSSPQSILLYGNAQQNEEFAKQFYTLLEKVSNLEYGEDNASLASLKFNQLIGDVIDGKVKTFKNNTATLYLVNSTSTNQLYHSCGGGYFYTNEITNLQQIIHFITNKVQTISYFGLSQDAIQTIAKATAGLGVDRIVPIGKALSFDYIWDGYNLCEELSSRKFIQ